MTRPKPINLGLSREQLEVLGLFTAQWSFLETEIEMTISCLGANVDGDQSVPFSFNDKLKRWRKLAKAIYKEAQVFAECEKIINDSKSAQHLRGILAHGRIEGDPSGRIKSFWVEHNRHRRDEWNVQPYNLPVRGVRKWAMELGRLSIELIKFNKKHLPGEPYTLPRKFVPRPKARMGKRVGRRDAILVQRLRHLD